MGLTYDTKSQHQRHKHARLNPLHQWPGHIMVNEQLPFVSADVAGVSLIGTKATPVSGE